MPPDPTFTGRCGDCRFWGDDDDRKEPAVIEGKPIQLRCRAVRHAYDDPTNDDPPIDPDFRDIASVMDSSGYQASLNTTAEFGCVLWRSREVWEALPVTPEEHNAGSRRACLRVLKVSSGGFPLECCNLPEGHDAPCLYVPPGEGGPRGPTPGVSGGPVAEVIRVTAEFYGYSVEELISMDRHKQISEARQVAAYLARHTTAASYPEIGRALGGHHTTIMFAVDRITTRVVEDLELRGRVATIREKLGAR